MKLFLVRHGETEDNKAGIVQGHKPGKLSRLGKQQAQKLGKRLQKNEFDMIYSSDLTRALQTSEYIRSFHLEVPFLQTQELREVNRGEWEGRLKSDIRALIQQGKIPPQPKKGETNNELLTRAHNLLSFLVFKHPHDCILLVGHNRINKAIIAALTKQKQEDIEQLQNTSVCAFLIHEDFSFETLLMNDTGHLRDF